MTSDRLPPQVKNAVAAHPEVEFALVLARTIDAVNGDPEQLRSAVYELARHKLQQLSEDDPTEKARLMQALEVAIAGVESHMTTAGQQSLPRQPTPLVHRVQGEPRLSVSLIEGPERGSETLHAPPASDDNATRSVAVFDVVRRLLSFMPARLAVVLLLIVMVVGGIASARRHDLAALQSLLGFRTSAPAAAPVAAPPSPLPEVPIAAATPAAPARDPRLPTAYGVYAATADRLFDLQQLPGRVPDPRVAISAAITKPSETTLPDGRARFVVFQRDSAADVFEKVEVRVIARVRQATSFDPSGKPIVSNEDETWVVRNISIPCRAAPMKDDPQMYEVTPRDPDLQFPAGRYALIVKGRAFDFSIAGPVTDKRQCLERLVAANGTFYSECQKP
ncbi:hypothetical protein LQG66_21050 [Bradyrhizobium ontarionense]|uniref:Uncharacterized protein n=1 Tax=Bradyrhizobium ontarionense TaxID=2898149 RepID=A0ABY3R3D6_9BRAD|nr:hypothetical protein [Bradyrhizobium sp. A19]UFZ01801.1 hypothetical protein LQG66_21050 [Bradyrhizobium sp. A19]